MRMPSECLTSWNLVQTVGNGNEQKTKVATSEGKSYGYRI